MKELIAITFHSKKEADRALEEVWNLEEGGIVTLMDACVVERRDDGKVKLHQTVDTATPFVANGMFWGLLVGFLFGLPLVGSLTGAAAGGLSGLLTDLGVSDRFMKDLGGRLPAGSAALFILYRDGNFERFLEEIKAWPADVLHTSLNRDAEKRLQDAMRGLNDAEVERTREAA